MTLPHHEEGVPFARRIDPESYLFDDFTDILAHPELAPETVEPHQAYTVMGALVELGHTALIRGGVEAYQPWSHYAATFAEAQDQRPDTEDFTYRNQLTGLYFRAAIHGDAEAGALLRKNLAQHEDVGDEDFDEGRSTAILHLLAACQSEGVYPGFWIDQYATDADDRATLWASYFSPYRPIREFPIAEAELQHGTRSTQQAFLEGTLSGYATIDWARHALRFAASADEKQQISVCLRGLGALIELDDEDEIDEFDFIDVLPVAANLMVDPDISASEKQALEQECRRFLPDWEVLDAIEARAMFEFSCMIRDGASNDQIRAHIQTILYAVSDAEAALPDEETGYDEAEEKIYGQPLNMSEEGLVETVAHLYVLAGQDERAALYISTLNPYYSWKSAVDHYIKNGGNTTHLRKLEKVNELLEAAKATIGITSERFTAQREATLDYADSMAQTPPDYQRAFGALAAQLVGVPTHRLGQLRQLDELLSKDPSLIARRQEIAKSGDRSYMISSLRSIFVAHHDAQATAEEWYEVQTGRYNAPMYLARFAETALIACGVLNKPF